MSGLTIMLVDDHPIVREGYRRLLERQAGYRVVAEAEDCPESYRLYRATSPDVVVMDLSLPGPGGLEAVRMPGGEETRLPALPIEMDGIRPNRAADLPAAGADTRAVLAGLGYDADRLDALMASGAIEVAKDG